MTGFASFDHTQSAVGNEAAHSDAGSIGAEASSTSEPGNGKAEAEPAFEATVAQEMRIDGAVDDRQAQARDKMVFQLFPDEFGVGFFVFQGVSGEKSWELTVES